MKEIIEHLDKSFENRVRLGTMSILMVNDSIDFSALKEALDVSDGNLASHIAALEKSGYVEISKQFVGKKPNTTYRATREGKLAFGKHLNALEKILNKH